MGRCKCWEPLVTCLYPSMLLGSQTSAQTMRRTHYNTGMSILYSSPTPVTRIYALVTADFCTDQKSLQFASSRTRSCIWAALCRSAAPLSHTARSSLRDTRVPGAARPDRRLPGKHSGALRRSHLLLYVPRVLLHELGEADVIGAEAAESVQDAGLAGVQERQLLGHLTRETSMRAGERRAGFRVRPACPLLPIPAGHRACSR